MSIIAFLFVWQNKPVVYLLATTIVNHARFTKAIEFAKKFTIEQK